MRSTAVIIGYGRMGREHERAYHECGVDVIAKLDTDTDPWEIPKSTYVSVCTYDDTHAGFALAALRSGARVLVEKPLCQSPEDLRQIYEESRNGQLYCNLPLLSKTWPDGSKADGLQADYHWGRADHLPGWRARCPGYSFVTGAGVHMTSLLLRLKGRSIEWVEATGAKARPEISCETLINARGEFVGGGVFSMVLDCCHTGPHVHHVSITEPDRFTSIENYGTDKIAGIKRFIGDGKFDSRRDNTFGAHSVCFAIQRAIKTMKRETVEYLL